jgi:hypothetical protein
MHARRLLINTVLTMLNYCEHARPADRVRTAKLVEKALGAHLLAVLALVSLRWCRPPLP